METALTVIFINFISNYYLIIFYLYHCERDRLNFVNRNGPENVFYKLNLSLPVTESMSGMRFGRLHFSTVDVLTVATFDTGGGVTYG